MTSELGSAKRSSIVSKLFSISGVRRIIHTGLPRHSTVICCPNSNLEISARAGAPAARALALGFQEATKGTATPTAPTAPTTDVAPTRKRRRPLFTPSLLIKGSPHRQNFIRALFVTRTIFEIWLILKKSTH